MNEDKFLYTVSEESVLKSWDNDTFEEHEFSEAYNKFREDLIRRVSEDSGAGKSGEKSDKDIGEEVVLISGKKSRKKWYRRPAGIAAAVAAAFILSAGAYAISGLFRVKVSENTEDNGSYTYEFEAADGEDGVMVQPMRLVPNYIPEGYEYLQEYFEDEDGIKKYHKTDGSSGLTIVLENYHVNLTFPYISFVENTEINGVKTDILTTQGKAEFNHVIIMFYEELGQIVTIYGYNDIPLDELKKVAENIALEPTGGEAYKAFAEEWETTEAEPILMEDGRKVRIGEAMEYKDDAMNKKLSFVVKDIDIRDSISELSKDYFTDYERITSLLDENGKFDAYERTETVWENNALVEKRIGEVHPGFACVTIEITNLSDEPATDEFVYGNLVYKNSETGEAESEIFEGLGNEPVYYDGSDYLDGVYNIKLYHSDFEAGETRTVHLGVLFMRERQDEAYLQFFNWTNLMDTCYVKLMP